MCDTSTFTANVSGVGALAPFNQGYWGMFSLYNVIIDITTDHPQTLEITLTSPAGTTLLLSAFNGAGGSNYTATEFVNEAFYPAITTGTAPFTGNFTPQGGQLSIFDWENADGIWTITVVDTACAVTSPGPGGDPYTEGWFNGAASGGFTFAFSSPPPPQCWGAIPSDAATICAGGSFDVLDYYIQQNNAYNYWIGDQNWNMVPDPSAVTVAGNYNIEAYDPWDGCVYWATFSITVEPGGALGPDAVVQQCISDGPVDLNAVFGVSGASSAWTFNGAPITPADASAASIAGVYELIEGQAGCSDTAMVTLDLLTGPTLGADQSIDICSGASIDLTSLYSTGGSTTEWNFNGSPFTNPDAAVDGGIYSLIATEVNGCSDQADVTINVTATPSLGVDLIASFCSNTSLDLTSLFNTAGLTTQWSISAIPVADPTGVTGGGTYQLVASNGASCADTALVMVTVDVAPVLEPDMMASTCEGEGEDLVSYFANAAGLTTTWTYAGNTITNPDAATDAGIYTLVATDAIGCSDTANVQLTVSQPPALGADVSLTVCAGVAVDLTALFNTTGSIAIWEIGGVAVPDPENVLTSGVHTVTATNADGCISTASATIAHDPAPSLGADQSVTICQGSTVDLTLIIPSTEVVNTWRLGGALVADPTTVASSGSYVLVASNAIGCTDTAVVNVVVNNGPSLGPDQAFTLCPWQTVDLSSAFPVNGLNANYYFDGTLISDPTAISDEGSYVIAVTDLNGCVDTASATVLAMECLCLADLTVDARCMQDPARFTLLADSAIISARWDFGAAAPQSADIDPVIRFSSEGEVVVSLEATLSCGVVNVERTIRIEDCSDSCTVWVPSAFTPNGDEFNDSWSWKGECQPEGFNMQIFDRFGEIIYATTDPEDTWDGTVNGRMSPDGVYAYRVAYKLPYQDHKEAVGSIVLLR
jgi:gliding motility-associated-like protein